jgi:mRNA interferase MazF
LREPERGELYEADLDRAVGREQGGRRPILVVSIDPMNRSPAELVIAVAISTTPRGNLFHTRLDPAQSGLPKVSYAMSEMVRSLSTERLGRRLGRVPQRTVDAVARNVAILAGLGGRR